MTSAPSSISPSILRDKMSMVVKALCILFVTLCITHPQQALGTPSFTIETNSLSDLNSIQPLYESLPTDQEVEQASTPLYQGYFAPVIQSSSQENTLATTLLCPAHISSDESLRAHIHTTLPPKTAYCSIELSLQSADQATTYAKGAAHIAPHEHNQLTIPCSLDLHPLALAPGLYRLQLKETCATQLQMHHITRTALILVYGQQDNLSVGVICQMEAPAAVSAQGIVFDNQAALLTQQIHHLNELLDVVEAQDRVHLTLATTWMTLEDIRQLTQPPHERIARARTNPQNQPDAHTSQSAEDNAALPAGEQVRMSAMQHTLERIESLVEAGKLEIICNGYADPNPHVIDALHDNTLMTQQYASPQSCDWRTALNAPISPGCAPLIPPHSEGTLCALAHANVPWAALPYPSDGLAPTEKSSTLEDTNSLHTLEVLPYDAALTEALNDGHIDQIMSALNSTLLSNKDSALIICTTLTPNATANQISAIKTLLGLVASQPHWEMKSCNQILKDTPDQKRISAADLLQTSPSPQAEQSTTEDALNHVAQSAYQLTTALQEAAPTLEQTAQARLAFMKALSSAYHNDLSAQTEQFELACERVNEMFAHISVSAQAQHLTGTDGVVSVVVKNTYQEKMNLTVWASTSSTLELSDDQAKQGIAISSQAGDNFIQIPVRLIASGQELEQTPARLTIHVCAGDHVISSKTVEITSSRLDLTIFLFVIIGILIVLTFILRLRLRQYGMTTEADQEHLDQTVQEIKEELIFEEPKVIEEIGDIEGHDEAAEKKVTPEQLQELLQAGQTGAFEMPQDSSQTANRS